MAALLVALSILAVMMTVAMPVWKQNAQREKEEELVFRGKQYVHAIALFQRKYPGTYPPNLNVLFEQKFLRKKYKDPITDDDFVPIPFGQATPGGGSATPGAQPTGRGGAQQQSPSTSSTPSSPSAASRSSMPTSTIAMNTGRGSTFNAQTTVGGAGIQGVTSKSKDESIRVYNGRTHYNEWQFLYTAPAGRGAAQPGAVPGQPGVPGQPQPGPPGQRGRGQNPGGRPGFPGQQSPGFPPGGPNRGFNPGGQFPQQPFPQPGQPGGRGRL